MQDPTAFQSINPHFPEQEQLKCPRCDSTNTKFCYYNNYNLSQPRHFCKSCRRYWTKGGALRNIPVGGGSRKNSKRSGSKRPSSSSPTQQLAPKPEPPPPLIYNPGAMIDQDHRILDVPGSFSSLLTSNGHFTNLLESMNSNSTGIRSLQFGEFPENSSSSANPNSTENPSLELQSSTNPPENFLGLQGDSSCWGSGNGWPDLAIYTPGSRFQ